jgi:NAD+ diphosphatase
MLGFYARASDPALDFGDDELAEASWFTREELADPEALGIRLPRHDSIARRLIEGWLAAGAGLAGDRSGST